jgi:predicted acyltransferase
MNNINRTGKHERLLSLDVLRGLDMFFLVGLAGILKALPKISDNRIANWLAGQCEHPEWQGFTAWDVIFPMFIFIVGVAMPFSFSKRLNNEDGKKKLFKHVLVRSIILAIIGIILWQQPGGAEPHYGYYSVLYRIGFSYFFAAIIMMNSGIKGQVYWAFGLLLGHWLILRFVPVPGYGIGNFSQEGNVGEMIGKAVAKYISPDFKYVLNINLIPSISNALFGVLTGHWLMSDNTGIKKVKGLMMAGLLFIVAGLLVHLDFPINKKLSSPSFTLLTCGISASLLSLLYWIVDVKNHKKWAFFFVVVGMNSITIYIASSLVKFSSVANVFTGGFNFGVYQALITAIVLAAIKWLFLYYLYRQKIFLKI